MAADEALAALYKELAAISAERVRHVAARLHAKVTPLVVVAAPWSARPPSHPAITGLGGVGVLDDEVPTRAGEGEGAVEREARRVRRLLCVKAHEGAPL